MKRPNALAPAVILGLLTICATAWPWNPPTGTAGPLTISIEEFEDGQQLETPIPVRVTLENKGDKPITGQLRLAVIDEWRVEGDNPRPFFVTNGEKSQYVFKVVAGKGTYAAHYPVHAYADFELDGEKFQTHAVFVTKVLRAALGAVSAKPAGLGRLVALKALAPVKLDGDLSEWTNAIPVPLGEAQRSLGSISPGDFSAILYLLHDAENLYLGLRVTDDDISAEDTTSRDYVNSDYMRLYLAPQPPAKRKADALTSEDLLVAINPFAKGGPLLKVPAYGFATRKIPNLSVIRVAPKRTKTGCTIEVAIPFSLIGDEVREGSTIGFNLMLGDADKGHRQAELTVGSQDGEYWTSPACYVSLKLSSSAKDDGLVSLPITQIAGPGALALDRLGVYRVTIAREKKPKKQMPLGWTGGDQETGATFSPGKADRPDTKPCITIHPPYRTGVGRIWAEARFALSDIKPIKLTFLTAIRDHTKKEPPSDGVEWRVQVAPEGGEFKELFKRFSDAKTWQPAEVDLSEYAGKTITLRLWNGPGPKNDTTCDSGYWAEPTIIVGRQPEPETAQHKRERHDRAITRARKALAGVQAKFQWRIENPTGTFGVGWAAGPYGFNDGCLAFVTEDQQVVFDRFLMSINGEDLGDWRSKLRVVGGKTGRDPTTQTTTIMDFVEDREYGSFTIWSSMWAEDGAFKIKFQMPTVERNKRGEPRFTLLGPGPATVKARRVYAGFGNVIQEPEKFTLGHGGFRLSTRHIGIDFENGISLVQAADVFPYRFVVDPDKRLYSLQTGHDATMMFIPSTKGAFAAARVYRDVSGFEPAGGVEKLKGKMCIDWWGHHNIAKDIRRAGAYGLNDCVFIKHAWQRWGYDYRLPDIYPPSCDPDTWNAWVSACKEAGMLVAVHDNYIDFYPDASDFSYEHILFNPDGTPQRAWYNRGRKAQSYRWRPGAYNPWLERNIRLIKGGFAPTAYFIDVFSAIPLLDYYDQEGNFHTKVECAKHWGECFDYVRKTLGDNAPQISEAGHDGLVGHLDGAQSDHSSAEAWGWKCADADRTPWHDMATHGRFVLLAGGLGHRYAGGEPHASWGSDDYLSNTVMGGRNPMCIGPCTRATVMTYWLQHDICNELAHQSFESHEFVGDDIRHQHTTFGGPWERSPNRDRPSPGGEVWVNRGDEPWQVKNVTLPRYGYLAVSGDVASSITQKQGLPVGYAHSPQATFVDARPISLDIASRAPVKTRVLSAKHLGDGRIECEVKWEVLKPLPDGYVIFVHICHDKVTDHPENIAFHGTMDLPLTKLQQVGIHPCKCRFTIPADRWDGDYYLRYGLYAPKGGGGRLSPIAYMDGSRVRGGIFTVTKQDAKIQSIEHKPEAPGKDGPRKNTEGKMIDFGPIVTNGAFRLLHSEDEWRLLPLQGSFPFRAQIKLDRLGAEGKNARSVEGLDQEGAKLSDEKFEQDGGTLSLDLDAEAFSYRIALD